MENSPYAPPRASFDTKPSSENAFYVVTPLKLCMLFIGTVGYYTIYWHYKNWRCYKDHHPHGQEWPPARAIFHIFFVHDLFREASDYAAAAGEPLQWRANRDAGLMIALIVAWGIVERALGRGVAVETMAILWLVLGAALLALYCKVQRQINIACGDARGASNASVSWANCAWLVVGFVTWVGFIGSFFYRAN